MSAAITISVYEFDKVTKKDISKETNDKGLAEQAFDELKGIIFSEQSNEAEDIICTQAQACLRPGRKDGQEAISFNNYVGTISLKCGVDFEILPKIGKNSSNKDAMRRIVVGALMACLNISHKTFQSASLNTCKSLPLFECFIRLFLDEVNALYKKGLKAGYVPYEGNEHFLKGKLKFGKHIKYNFAHAERFYVAYDIYSYNRAENKLIKSTLLYLKNKSRDGKNLRDIRRFISIFDEIDASDNIDADFNRCESGRAAKYYERVMKLCSVFLREKSFTPYGGNDSAFALLFPMDKLFEGYFAKKLEEYLYETHSGVEFHKQFAGKYLFEGNKFLLKPDIFLKGQNGNIIIDTKWKVLDAKVDNYGISQGDMYQMYAYHTRYDNVRKVALLYPFTSGVPDIPCYKTNAVNIDVVVQVCYFDIYRHIYCSESFESCCVISAQEEGMPWKI